MIIRWQISNQRSTGPQSRVPFPISQVAAARRYPLFTPHLQDAALIARDEVQTHVANILWLHVRNISYRWHAVATKLVEGLVEAKAQTSI